MSPILAVVPAKLRTHPDHPAPRPLVLTATEVRVLLTRGTTIRRPINMAELQVVLPRRVASEGLVWLTGGGMAAARGTYPATMNNYGAVCVQVDGKGLGVKPGEFHFVCPFAEGETEHVRRRSKPSPTSGTPWRIVPREGSILLGQEMWRTEEDPTTQIDGIRFAVDDAFVPIVNTREAADRWVEAHENGQHGTTWRSAETMPAWAVRLRRRPTSVGVERVGAGWAWTINVVGPENAR